jgi:hypothetical protein
MIRVLLDLIRLDGFAYIHSPTNIFHDILDESCSKAMIGLQ